MSRLMSVAMTTDAVIERRKTVTRRKGWTFLKPGDTLTLCRKVQGRKPGEPLERLAEVEVVSAWRERLSSITWQDVCREGFIGMNPHAFIQQYFVDAQGIDPDDEVTRIEWRYLDWPCDECGTPTTPCPHGFNLCPDCRDAGCQPCADDTDPLDAAHETRRDDEAIDARREAP